MYSFDLVMILSYDYFIYLYTSPFEEPSQEMKTVNVEETVNGAKGFENCLLPNKSVIKHLKNPPAS